MRTVTVNIPSSAIRLSGVVDIRNWLLNVESLGLEQFAIDWIEKYADQANAALASGGIENTDDEFRAAIHYEIQSVLQVLKTDALCRQFFMDLESLTRSRPDLTLEGEQEK